MDSETILISRSISMPFSPVLTSLLPQILARPILNKSFRPSALVFRPFILMFTLAYDRLCRHPTRFYPFCAALSALYTDDVTRIFFPPLFSLLCDD